MTNWRFWNAYAANERISRFIKVYSSHSPTEGDLPPSNHIAFGVEDVDAACAALTQQGLTVEIAPKAYYWGRSAYLRDPDGHQVEITKGV